MGTSWSSTCFTWKSATGCWEIPFASATKLDHFPVLFVEVWGVYLQDAGKAVKEFWCFILLCIVWEEDHPEAIRMILGTNISLYSHLTSAKNRIMLNHSAASKVFECSNTMGPWDKHVNRKCKACGLCMSQWVLIYTYIVIYRISHVCPIYYTHISLFEFNQILFFLHPNAIPATKSQQRLRGIFLHSAPWSFRLPKQEFFDWAKSTCPKKECNWANWVYNW